MNLTNLDVQPQLDNLHKLFAKKLISRLTYMKEVDELAPWVDDAFLKRKDHRSLGEFALQIHDNTVREKFLLGEWLKAHYPVREDIIWEDNGIANDGRLILNHKGDSGRPDYRIKSDKGQWKLEIKFGPSLNKMTFKVADLKGYLRSNANILLIIGAATMIGPNGAIADRPLKIPPGLRWALFGPGTMKRMMGELPVRTYGPHILGDKPCVQLLGPEQIDRFLRVQEWCLIFPQGE